MMLQFKELKNDPCIILEYENEKKPFLLLGSHFSAKNRIALEKYKITHILNISEDLKNYFENKYDYLNILLFDDEDEEIENEFQKAHEFISIKFNILY
jgi:hypothetical protein